MDVVTGVLGWMWQGHVALAFLVQFTLVTLNQGAGQGACGIILYLVLGVV